MVGASACIRGDLVLRLGGIRGALDETEKEERRNLWLRWLPLFRELYRTCYEATETKGESGSTQAAVLAYMRHRQHRMRPTIADLISKGYYGGRIKSETVDLSTG